MRLLDISADLGPGATPASLEALVRGIRVATDVARDADIRALRRTVTEQMKFPTDAELEAATETLARGDERSPRYHAQMQLDARKRLRSESRGLPADLWFDYFYRSGRGRGLKGEYALQAAGYERLFASAQFPLTMGAVGLDVLDPPLYQALVADALARSMPTTIGVRELRYENPFFKRLFGKGTAEQTISTTAQVIETVSTLGSTRKMAKADASVAEQTVTNRIEESDLDVQLKRIAVERERERLLSDRIANARALGEMNSERRQQAIVEAAMRNGLLDVADSVGELDAGDATALGDLGARRLELEQGYERDEPEDP